MLTLNYIRYTNHKCLKVEQVEMKFKSSGCVGQKLSNA